MIVSGPAVRVGAAALCAVALTACGGAKHPRPAAITPSSTSPATPSGPRAAKPPPAVNPLTGARPSAHPVVAVKIDDTAAGRPQLGVDQADIVYVEEAEGGLTRLLAVFDTTLPRTEPVRSTRPSDPELGLQYGPIDYVASGGSDAELLPMDRSPLRSDINDRGGPGFLRDPDRPAPFNLVADLAVIAAHLHGPKAKDVGLIWSQPLVNQVSRPGPAVNTVVGGTPVAFIWDTRLRRYARVIDGLTQRAADGRVIATPNVIVQFCDITTFPQDIDSAGNPAEYTHTVGSGRVAVFRDGRRIDGTWRRVAVRDGTHLVDSRGTPIALAPGGAWFVLVAASASVS